MRTLGVLAAVIAIVAVGASAEQRAVAKGDDPAIAKIRAAYQAASAAQEGAAIAKLYAPDGIEMPPNAPAAKGRAAIEAYHKALGQQFMVHAMTITASETHVMGDRAADIGTYKQQLMGMKSGAINDDTGKYIVLLKKDASGAIYNSDVAPPAPPAAKK
jgi:uncharacterized protein (TIGR02246 family)